MEKIWNSLTGRTADYMKVNGFKEAIVALSGGIDSSVVAAIAAQAIGPKNILGVMMPSPYSSEGSILDAQALADSFKIKTIKIPIGDLMVGFDHALAPYLKREEGDITQQNIQARIRAVLVMALSNKRGSILLNTCNKSEDYVGYATLYGDSCGGIAPIGDLYKTEVYELARWINEQAKLPDIPEVCISKAPSAELCADQKDTDSLPPYEVLDSILRLHVDDNLNIKRIVAKGYDQVLVAKILHLVRTSQFKRDQSPPPIIVDRR